MFKFKFKWREKLGYKECPYMERWVLDLGIFSIRLHHWLGSDDSRYMHDHPFDFITIILKGGYTDKSPLGNKKMRFGSIAYRKAEHIHTVQLDGNKTCWSLLFIGPDRRKWGFWVNGKFRKRNKYFFEKRHHQCDDK